MKRTNFFFILAIFVAVGCSSISRDERSEVSQQVERSLSVNGTTLNYSTITIDRTQPYLVFLSGGPGSPNAYERAFANVMGLGMNAIFVDQRGCGKSDRSVDPKTFTFEMLANDLDEILQYEKIQKVILVGHSWGAIYGLEYVLRHPKKVLAVIFINGVTSWESALENYRTYAEQYAYDHIRLVKKMKNNTTLNAKERLDFERFCAFMATVHKNDEVSPYSSCAREGSQLSQEQLGRIQMELKDDLDAVERFWPEKRWKAWSAKNIRVKYGMYRYKAKPDKLEQAIFDEATRLYSAEEMKYSKVMENGLSISEPEWGEKYNSLQRVKKLKIPFYYFVGKYDVIFRSAQLADYVQNTYGLQYLVEFEKSGHSPLEEPLKLKKEIEDIYRKELPRNIPRPGGSST